MRLAIAIAALAALAGCAPTPNPVVLQHPQTKQTVSCDGGGLNTGGLIGESQMRGHIASCVEQYQRAGFVSVGETGAN